MATRSRRGRGKYEENHDHFTYKVIPNENAKARKMIKLMDDTGGEYWFSASCFVPVELSIEAERDFALLVA
jgi:hypothetical protein